MGTAGRFPSRAHFATPHPRHKPNPAAGAEHSRPDLPARAQQVRAGDDELGVIGELACEPAHDRGLAGAPRRGP